MDATEATDAVDPAPARGAAAVRDPSGEPLHPFLDPGGGARFWVWIDIMPAVFAVVGFVVWVAGSVRSGRGR